MTGRLTGWKITGQWTAVPVIEGKAGWPQHVKDMEGFIGEAKRCGLDVKPECRWARGFLKGSTEPDGQAIGYRLRLKTTVKDFGDDLSAAKAYADRYAERYDWRPEIEEFLL